MTFPRNGLKRVRRAVFAAMLSTSSVALLRSGVRNILIVGDSHSTFLSGSPIGAHFFVRGDQMGPWQFWSAWLGPRLAFSVARDGLPIWLRSSIRFFDAVVLCVGEIDTRTRFAQPIFVPEQTASGLADLANKLAHDYPGVFVSIAEPPPPGTDWVSSRLPYVGDIAERIEGYRRFRSGLRSSVHARNVNIISAPEDWFSADFSLDPRVTLDGLHINDVSALKWRQQFVRQWAGV